MIFLGVQDKLPLAKKMSQTTKSFFEFRKEGVSFYKSPEVFLELNYLYDSSKVHIPLKDVIFYHIENKTILLYDKKMKRYYHLQKNDKQLYFETLHMLDVYFEVENETWSKITATIKKRINRAHDIRGFKFFLSVKNQITERRERYNLFDHNLWYFEGINYLQKIESREDTVLYPLY